MDDLRKVLGDTSPEPRFLVLDTSGLDAWSAWRKGTFALPLHEQLPLIEQKLDEEWAAPNVENLVNDAGLLVEQRKWMNEPARFLVMEQVPFDPDVVGGKKQVLVVVEFPKESDRDFEKFWNDFVGSYVPDWWEPVAWAFRDGKKGRDHVSVSSCTYTVHDKETGY